MEITLDKFLDGKLRIYQPKKGYRAGIDAVLLAASVKERNNLSILDVGSGSGVISFCLAYRCNNVSITGIEKNKDYYLLSLKSFKKNNKNFKINFINKDFKKLDKMQFSVIVSNPPWFPINSIYESKNSLINEAKIESISLDRWINKVCDNLELFGEYYTIFPYDRINEIIDIMKNYFNLIKIYPLASFVKDKPNKAIIYAKKTNNKYKLWKFDKIIIHKSDKSFMDNIKKVLREGSSLSLA